jgi:hypothetical protein
MPTESLGIRFKNFDEEGNLVVTERPRIGTEIVRVSHDIGDPCTWYQNAVQVVDEVASDSGDGLTFNLAHNFLIDMRHGRILEEDSLNDGDMYNVVVKVNSSTKTEHTPLKVTFDVDDNPTFSPPDADYGVDYEKGQITFASSQSGNTVEVSYYYATSFDFITQPPDGKEWEIIYAEAQAETSIIPVSSVTQAIYAMIAPDTWVPAFSKTYKTLYDFAKEAINGTPLIQGMGGAGNPRATGDMRVFYFNYVCKATIKGVGSPSGDPPMQFRLLISDNMHWRGGRCTLTFYGTERDVT